MAETTGAATLYALPNTPSPAVTLIADLAAARTEAQTALGACRQVVAYAAGRLAFYREHPNRVSDLDLLAVHELLLAALRPDLTVAQANTIISGGLDGV